MGRGKELTEFEKGQINGLASSGLSNRKIAAIIKRSRNVVNNYLRDQENYGKKKSSGRPKVLSERNRRSILREVRVSGGSVGQVKAATNVPGSWWTVWRVIKGSPNIEYTRGQRKPDWKKHHIDARRQFAINHVTWADEWTRVIFSDEKKWNLDGPDGCQYYWHDLRDEKHWFKKRGHNGGSVMTWGAFGAGGQTDLMIISGRMDSEDYKTMLKDALLPIANNLGGPGWIFQQDNASIHVSWSTLLWFVEAGIDWIEWPALSPDLNPIEDIWGMMVRMVYANGREFNTTEELTRAIKHSWHQIKDETLWNLVQSMHKRMIAVIANPDKPVKY